MPTVNVPEGFAAVVVLIAKSANDDTVNVVYENQEEGTEHALLGEAIAALASAQVDIADGFIEEIESLEAELQGDDDGDGDGEGEPEEPS